MFTRHRTRLNVALPAVIILIALTALALAASRSTAAPVARYRWSTLAPSPLKARTAPLLAWTGRELIELGGVRKGATTYDGAAYNPVTGRWHKIAPMLVNVGFDNATDVWTGRQLFVTNGQTASCPPWEPLSNCLPRAGLYNPVANRWTTTLLPRALEGFFPEASAWTGRDVILGAVRANHGNLAVASYDPATRRWRMTTPPLPRHHPYQEVTMVATANRVILWALWGTPYRYGVDVFALNRSATWRNVTGHWPQDKTVTSPFFTGHRILVSPGQVWCGPACPAPFAALPGCFANPSTLRRTLIPLGPIGQSQPAFIWTGQGIIAIDLTATIFGPGPTHIRPDDMALYTPASRRWTRLPAAPHHPELAATPLWTGHELLTLTASGQLLSFES